MFSFFNPWKYQKTFGFLVFQGAQHRNGKIGQKWTKEVNRYKILINPLSVSLCLSLSLSLSFSLSLSLSVLFSSRNSTYCEKFDYWLTQHIMLF